MGACSIYDKVERMSISATQAKNGAVRLPWRAVCFVLGLFLLYNPFFTICAADSPAATVQHHVSYRSTIAASELGCSDLQRHPEVSVEAIIALFATIFELPRPAEVIAPRPSEETVAAPDGFAFPLWSRPPPTL